MNFLTPLRHSHSLNVYNICMYMKSKERKKGKVRESKRRETEGVS